MAEIKTQRTKASVTAFLASLPDPDQRKDAKRLASLMRRATGKVPSMWGTSIVGYGSTTYTGRSGTVDWFLVGFAPRKAALTVYLMGGLSAHADLVKRLGRYRTGGGCLYLPSLEEVDQAVLSRLIAKSYKSNFQISQRPA